MKLTIHVNHNESFQNDLNNMFPLDLSVKAEKDEDSLVLTRTQIREIKEKTGLPFRMLSFLDDKKRLWRPVSGIHTECDFLMMCNMES